VIDKYQEYVDKMNELFENKVDVQWFIKPDALYGKFSIIDKEFLIVINKEEFNSISTNFYMKYDNYWLTDLTNINDMFITSRVLSTVRFELEEYVKLNQPDAIIFLASDDSRGRKTLYNNFCYKFQSKFNNYNYNKYENKTEKITIFVLYNLSFDLNNLQAIGNTIKTRDINTDIEIDF
jgi:hypothetical protein